MLYKTALNLLTYAEQTPWALETTLALYLPTFIANLILTVLDVWYGEGFLASQKASDHRWIEDELVSWIPSRKWSALSLYQKVSKRLTCNEELVFSLLGLLAGSESLVLLSLCYKVVCLIDSGVEVTCVREKLCEIDNVLVKKSTSNDWSMLVSKSLKDCLVNSISYILFQLFSLVVSKLLQIDTLWERQCWHWWLSTTFSHLSLHWLSTCLSDSTHALTRPLWLFVCCVVIAILWLLTHVVVSLGRILVLWMLTLTPVVVLACTSSTASSASIIVHAASTKITSVVPAPLAVHVAAPLLLAIICLVAVSFTAFFHDKTDQLLKACIVFLFSLVGQVNFWLPKVNLDWSIVHSEFSWFIKHFNTFLSWCYILEKNISVLVVHIALSINFIDVVLQFNWCNLTSLWEFISDNFFSDIFWQKSNEYIRFECFLLVLNDWVAHSSTFSSLEQIIIFLVNMWHHDDSVVVDFDLHLASSFNSFFGIFVFCETNESCSWFIRVEFVRSHLTKLLEETLQILNWKSWLWQILNVQVGISVTLVLSVILLGMNHNLDIFFTNLGIVQLLDCLLGSILSFKLNITKSSTFTIGINFEFTGFDISKWFEHIVQFFLISFLW